MADEFPPNFTTDIGRIRKYIPDLKQVSDPAYPDAEPEYIFSDAEIESFLDDHNNFGSLETKGWMLKRAAGWALLAIANDEALTLKKIVTEDLQTDGPAVANALQKAADKLFTRADLEQYADSEQDIFITVPYFHSPPRYDWR